MASLKNRLSGTQRGRSWSRLSAAIVAMVVGTAGVVAQNPMVTRSTLPMPSCSTNAYFGVADFDMSGQPDFLYGLGGPAPKLAVNHDPVTSPFGSTCHLTAIPVAPSTYAPSAMPASLNGDAFPDAIVFVGNENRILEALGDGGGAFLVPGSGPYPAAPATGYLVYPVVCDFNGDGRDDLAVSHGIDLEVFLNLPSGWTLSWSQPIGFLQYQFGAGDFDGDGNPDLLWTMPTPGTTMSHDLRIAHGTGFGTFVVSTTALVTNSNFHSFDEITDLDGDGRDDLIVRKLDVAIVPYHIPIVWGVSGTELPLVTFIATSYETFDRAHAGDFDRDGVVDLVLEATPIGNLLPHDIVMYRGLGGRQFSAPIVFSTEPYPALTGFQLYLADVDGDQDLDLLRPSSGYFSPYQLLLFRNETIRAPGCPGTLGLTPSCSVGVATPGNAAFAIGLLSAFPNSIAALGVSLAPVAVSGCGVAIDLAASQLILPMGSVGIMATGPGGTATMALPLPPPPALRGMAFYAQWGVLDPQGSLPAVGYTFALSDARTIYVW